MNPSPEPSPLAPGYRLDRYELLCPIADGGMASVWIARQTGKHGFQKLVAIKTILPKYAADASFQQMFLDEVRIASKIEHAHVTQILDVGEQHGVTYLVMEYVDGDALSKVHREARQKGTLIPPGVLLRLMADACGGLHAAHELVGADGNLLGVVHRDVSPQNILVSTKGVAKIIDFGIAKARDRLAEDTNAGQLKGKVRYMPPEQALGRTVDRRADVFAVGASLYHLLSGRAPFEAENDMQTLYLLASGRPAAPMKGEHHPAIAAVVYRALSPDPEGRFRTCAEMQEALEDATRQADLMTTTAAVGQYLTGEMGGRADKRREAISVGLKAAQAREQYNDLMRSHTEPLQTSTSGPGAASVPRQRVLSPDSPPSDKMPPVEIISTVSSSSGQTLGSAGVAVADTQRDRARGLKLAVLGSAVAGAVIWLLAIFATPALRNDAPGANANVPVVATTAARPVATAPPEVAATAAVAASIASTAPPRVDLSAAPDSSPAAARAHPVRVPVKNLAPPKGSAGSSASAAPPASQDVAPPPPSSTVAPRENYGF